MDVPRRRSSFGSSRDRNIYDRQALVLIQRAGVTLMATVRTIPALLETLVLSARLALGWLIRPQTRPKSPYALALEHLIVSIGWRSALQAAKLLRLLISTLVTGARDSTRSPLPKPLPRLGHRTRYRCHDDTQPTSSYIIYTGFWQEASDAGSQVAV